MSWLAPDKCCFFIPLKIGCYILAIMVLISGIYSIFGVQSLVDQDSTASKCYPKFVNLLLGILDIVTFLFSTFAAMYFLYALCTDNSNQLPTILFMIGFGMRICFFILAAFILAITVKGSSSCPSGLNFGLGTLFGVLLNVYWLLCVNGYRENGPG